MRRHQIGVRASLERDLQQVAGIEPKDRTAVGGNIADARKPRRDALDRVEIRRVDQVMDFARAVSLLIDRGDFDLEHEAHRRAACRRQCLRDRLLDVTAQPVESRLGGDELLLEFGAPGRMREVAGGDDADPFACRPGGKMFEVEIPARRARIFGVDVQVRVEAHATPPFAVGPTPVELPGARPARRYKGAIRSEAKSAPVDIRPVACACSLGVAAQDCTRGPCRGKDARSVKPLKEPRKCEGPQFGTMLENCRLHRCKARSRSSSSTRIRPAPRSWKTRCARLATCTWPVWTKPRTSLLVSLGSTPTSP